MRKIWVLVGVAFLMLSLSGCATSRKAKELETQGLRNQIQALESQLQSKDQEINALRDSASKAEQEKQACVKKAEKRKIVPEVKERPSVKQIQVALKNAGYNPGSIDGRMGSQTRVAIRSFQKANNLKVTGKADKQTWRALRKYLSEKVK